MDRLVPHSFGQRESFVEGHERVVVVALPGQGQPAHEAAEEQRDQHARFAGQRQSFGLHLGRLPVVARPVSQEPADSQ